MCTMMSRILSVGPLLRNPGKRSGFLGRQAAVKGRSADAKEAGSLCAVSSGSGECLFDSPICGSQVLREIVECEPFA